MIRPRWLAHLVAYLGGYFWIPCPVCRQPFAGFERHSDWGICVDHKVDGGTHECKTVCQKPGCVLEAQRQTEAFNESVRASRAGKIVHLR